MILTQKCLQRLRERHAGTFVHLHLIDPGEVDFNRVLGRRNIDFDLVQDVDPRIQRHRFAATRRSGDEKHAVGFVQVFQEQFFLEVFVAELIDLQLRRVGIENTHDGLFTEQGRTRADAEVD